MKHLNSYRLFEQKKTFPKIKSDVLMPLNNYNKQILQQTNQTILKKLISI